MDADMNDDEREVQIRLDAEQYIPFPLDEVSLDFEVLPDRHAESKSCECTFSRNTNRKC
jgi:Tfp pilus assembly PilM family ATPase